MGSKPTTEYYKLCLKSVGRIISSDIISMKCLNRGDNEFKVRSNGWDKLTLSLHFISSKNGKVVRDDIVDEKKIECISRTVCVKLVNGKMKVLNKHKEIS